MIERPRPAVQADTASAQTDVALVLHAHLPYCRQPDMPASLEETWFFEALTGSYLPLVAMLDRLERDGVRARLTLSLSPTLLCLLRDRELFQRYRHRLEQTERLARRDAARGPAVQRELASWHADLFAASVQLLEERCAGNLVKTFAEFQQRGVLELATTAATHAFLPAFQDSPAVVRAQIDVGLDTFASAFGFRPDFFWLPECGYFPGIEEVLASRGVRACALESHALTAAHPPAADVRAPLRCPGGVRALGRDSALSALVWSASAGYPGDANYREFHRDRIHALDRSEVVEWLGGSDARLPSGLKYWRVTGPTENKGWYRPVDGEARAVDHARDFVGRIEREPRPGICLLPFDAELFGHWWFEGVRWLEHVLRLLDVSTIAKAATVSEAIERHTAMHEATPAASTWGHRGDNSFWVTHDNAWIYPRLAALGARLATCIAKHRGNDAAPLMQRALRQAARLLLLAQASDWPFMISAGTAADLASRHVSRLLLDLERLLDAIESGAIEEAMVASLERAAPAFPDLDLRYFAAT